MRTLHFHLVPDRSSARRLRRMVAENQARLGVIVGTWPELLEQARKAYLLVEPEDWTEALGAAAKSMKDAFWARSLEVAPEETLAEVMRALNMLIDGIGPTGKITSDTKKVLPERASKHLADLAALHEKTAFALPPQLSTIKSLLKADKSSAVKSIIVYHAPGFPELLPWQKALVEKLATDHAGSRDKTLDDILTQSLTWQGAKKGTALAALQQHLFDSSAKQTKLDETVQWLAVRDYLEEAEVAAGMVQKMMKDEKLKASEIGLLMPADRSYAWAIRDTFTLAGLPLSGLNNEIHIRDLGREAVLYFLLCRRSPAPVMAFASLLTSPLMPWTTFEGHALAIEVMNGNFDLEPPKDASRDAVKALSLIRSTGSTSMELADATIKFCNLLSASEGLEDHIKNAVQTADLVAARLRSSSGEIPWKEITSLSAPKSITKNGVQEVPQEGIAVFEEDQEPWRAVQQLIVLGFKADHYPSRTGRSSVFPESDFAILKNEFSYQIETAADRTRRNRALFLRQLAAASDGVTFFVPQRDAAGKPLRPSGTLTFMARLFKGIDDPSVLMFNIETEHGRAATRGLALAPAAKAVPPRAPVKADLNLERDLLTLRRRADGTPKPESPSSIEKLLVSPLAWFFSRADLEPSEWTAEGLEPAIKGTLAHKVFEELFAPGKPLPSEAEIRKRVPELLHRKVIKHKPMLLAKEWRIEYQHLAAEIEAAAIQWRSVLVEMKAVIIGTEVGLQGKLDDLPLYGETDLLLSLPGGRLLIVDYKKSKSKRRRSQMQKGWDSQTSLYRIMLKTGGPADRTQKELVDVIKAAKGKICVMYYLMNDQTALTDSSGWVGREVPQVEEMCGEISENAMTALRARIAELRQGMLVLNCEGDDKKIEKECSMPVYALEASPIVKLFMKDEEAQQ